MENLAITEQTRLLELEETIEHGLKTFVDVGNALMEIRGSRLYRESFGTFEDYCRERWGMSKTNANRMIAAAEVAEILTPIGVILPATESQARPLTSLPAEAQPVVWQHVVDTAPFGKITAAHVQQVVAQYKNPEPPQPKVEQPEIVEPENEDPQTEEDTTSFNYKRDMRRTAPQDIFTPQGMDACQTPPYALDPLLPFLLQFDVIWEPASGEGLMVDALLDCTEKNFLVIGSDLISGNNFFEYEPDNWDCLVTNPPYSIKYQWLERCYALGKPFALLMPIDTLGAKKAQELFKTYGVEIILLNKRVNFKMPNKGWDAGGAQFSTAWFTWGMNLGNQLVFGTIEYE